MRRILAFLFLCYSASLLSDGPPIHWYYGLCSSYRSYSEDLILPQKSEERGTFLGLSAGFESAFPQRLYQASHLSLAFSNVNYSGSMLNRISGEIQPHEDTSDSLMVDLETRLGVHFCLDESRQFVITPYAGVGAHRWYRGRVDSMEDDYTETYAWLFASLGLKTQLDLSDAYQVGLNARLLRMIRGQMVASFLGARFQLGNRIHYELELPITYRLQDAYPAISAFRLVFFGHLRPVGHSQLVGIWYEPNSRAWLLGQRLEVVHEF